MAIKSIQYISQRARDSSKLTKIFHIINSYQFLNKMTSEVVVCSLPNKPGIAKRKCFEMVRFVIEVDLDDEEEELTSEQVPDCAPIPLTVVQEMTHFILAARDRQSIDTSSSESALLDYLHRVSVTVSDVEAMIPALNHNTRIMRKLALNIGWHRAQDHITELELEEMLIHILGQGDRGHELFEQTKARVTYHLDEAVRNDVQKREREERQRRRAEEEAQRAQSWAQLCRRPAAVRGKKPAELIGTAQLQGEYQYNSALETPSRSWAQVVRAPAMPTKKEALAAKKPQPSKIVPAVPLTKAMVEAGLWVRSRLHNGPGLQDKKAPAVKLPSKDARLIFLESKTRVVRHDKGSVVASKPSLETLAILKRGMPIVVKLPSLDKASNLERCLCEGNIIRRN